MHLKFTGFIVSTFTRSCAHRRTKEPSQYPQRQCSIQCSTPVTQIPAVLKDFRQGDCRFFLRLLAGAAAMPPDRGNPRVTDVTCDKWTEKTGFLRTRL